MPWSAKAQELLRQQYAASALLRAQRWPKCHATLERQPPTAEVEPCAAR
jgi:hypothetical protein